MHDNKYFLEIEKAIDYIESHLERPISVKSVCSTSKFSAWQFQRIFRAYIGDSIGSYIRGRRLSTAATEIQRNPARNILDVAIKFQFNSQEAFTRAFKNQFRITPGQMRDHKSKSLPQYKPKLDYKRLTHIAHHITKKPTIKVLRRMTLVGLPIIIDSTLGNDFDIYQQVKEHWLKFNSLRHTINQSIEGRSYGVVSDFNQAMNDDKLRYLSSVEVKDTNHIPHEMQQQILEEKEYAVFEVKGNKKACQITADYVYGIWLPQSGYSRDEGFDFELFENPQGAQSHGGDTLSYYIPIKNNEER